MLGTGFLVRVPSETVPDKWHGYLVTAQHVIDDQTNPCELEIANPDQPGTVYDRLPVSKWCQPIEDLDLAVALFWPPGGYVATALEVGNHLFEHLPTELLLGAGFYYIGLLAPLNRVMARSGTIGAVYQSGLKHRGGYVYAAHLGDVRSYKGFSGSPCFVEYPVAKLTPQGTLVPSPPQWGPLGRINYLHLLCGMVTWHLEPPAKNVELSAFGVMCILTSDDIWRALMSEKLAAKRRKQDEISPEPEARQVNLGAKEAQTNEEFERTEALTRKLLKVPKKELDEKRREEGQ